MNPNFPSLYIYWFFIPLRLYIFSKYGAFRAVWDFENISSMKYEYFSWTSSNTFMDPNFPKCFNMTIFSIVNVCTMYLYSSSKQHMERIFEWNATFFGSIVSCFIENLVQYFLFFKWFWYMFDILIHCFR